MGSAPIDIGNGNTVSFARKLAESPRFKALFRDGMNLVEEVAAYLDGPGRDEAKHLARPVALAYAAESMRLTTRLMQMASWLLLQRAVNERELTQAQAAAEKNKVRLCPQDMASGPGIYTQLPNQLQELTGRSLRLQARLLFLDRSIGPPDDLGVDDDISAGPVAFPSELGLQWEKIRVAFHART